MSPEPLPDSLTTENVTRRRGTHVAVVLAVLFTTVFWWIVQPSAERRALKSILESINSSSSLKVMEGLPHPMFGGELLKKEIASKETVELYGHRFYEAALWLPDDTQATLRELTTSTRRYATYTGPKKCGGFHPDYALVWNGPEGKTVSILICFSCEEAMIRGETMSVLVDLDESAGKALQEVLAKHRKHRPALVKP